MEKMLTYVETALEAKDYDEFKKLTRDSKLNEMVFDVVENLDSEISDTVENKTEALEKQIDRLWGFIDNLSERAAETLDYNTELLRCMKIVLSHKGGVK